MLPFVNMKLQTQTLICLWSFERKIVRYFPSRSNNIHISRLLQSFQLSVNPHGPSLCYRGAYHWSFGGIPIERPKLLFYSRKHTEVCVHVPSHISISVCFSFLHPFWFSSHHSIYPLQWQCCIRTIPEPLQPYSVPRPRLWHSWLGQKKDPLALPH